jgi:hypothetical protein
MLLTTGFDAHATAASRVDVQFASKAAAHCIAPYISETIGIAILQFE